jgi:hypothetical protein
MNNILRKEYNIKKDGTVESRIVYILSCLKCSCEIKRAKYQLDRLSGYCKKCAPSVLIKKEKYNLDTKVCKSCLRELNVKSFSLTGSGHVKSSCITCSNLKNVFNITYFDYTDMLRKQNNSCDICGVKHTEEKKLVVDHCHKTGKVRALLCSKCNTGIGMFNENKEYLLNAIKYIKKNENKI